MTYRSSSPDDIADAGFGQISLTTIAIRLAFKPSGAVSLLSHRIERPDSAPRHIGAPVDLQIRAATAPPQTPTTTNGHPSAYRCAQRDLPDPPMPTDLTLFANSGGRSDRSTHAQARI
jgi:hypothetical protein